MQGNLIYVHLEIVGSPRGGYVRSRIAGEEAEKDGGRRTGGEEKEEVGRRTGATLSKSPADFEASIKDSGFARPGSGVIVLCLHFST